MKSVRTSSVCVGAAIAVLALPPAVASAQKFRTYWRPATVFDAQSGIVTPVQSRGASLAWPFTAPGTLFRLSAVLPVQRAAELPGRSASGNSAARVGRFQIARLAELRLAQGSLFHIGRGGPFDTRGSRKYQNAVDLNSGGKSPNRGQSQKKEPGREQGFQGVLALIASQWELARLLGLSSRRGYDDRTAGRQARLSDRLFAGLLGANSTYLDTCRLHAPGVSALVGFPGKAVSNARPGAATR